jgi:antitoxin FitA
MPNLSIKDVPEPLAEALRRRAAIHHRSLQGELMAIIEAAVAEQAPNAPSTFDSRGARGQPLRRGWKSIEQTAADQDARGFKMPRGLALGVDIIRNDRDSR